MEQEFKMDKDELDFIKESLENLLDEFSIKPKEKLKEVLKMFNVENKSDLIKIQNHLEELCDMDIDSFTRTEILNLISDLENLINN